MDSTTLLVMSLILVVFLICIWGTAGYLFKASTTTSIHFMLTNITFASFMGFYVCRGIWPNPTIYIISDMAVVLGCLLLRRSIQEFTEIKKTDIEGIILLFIVFLFDLYARTNFPLNGTSMGMKIAIIVICLSSLYTIILLYQEAYSYMIKSFEKKHTLATLFPLCLVAIVLATRILLTILATNTVNDLRVNSSQNAIFLIVLIISIIGFNVTAMGLVISKIITQMKTLSQEDPLTRTFNRRHLNTVADKEILNSYRNKSPLSLIVLDIDYFKNVNDKYGHAAGDEALVACVDIIKKNIRVTDYIGRLGGEEFCILLPNTNLKLAHQIAERIRHHIEFSNITYKENIIPITASIGVTSLNHGTQTEWSNLLYKADVALYEAKKRGRNQVILK